MSEYPLKEVDFGKGTPCPTVTVRLGAAGRAMNAEDGVFIDGQRVKHCRGVTVQATTGQASIVTLELMALNVDLEVETDKVFAEATDVNSTAKQKVAV